MSQVRHSALLASALLFSVHVGAGAQQAPAPTSPPVPAVPALPEPEPPASQLAAAREVVISSGMARSFAPMVPELAQQIPSMLTRTRPELAKDLAQVITQLQPEFDKKAEEMTDVAAHVYARHMSEQELRETAAFFNTPAGTKYKEAQPKMLDELVLAMQAWTQNVSNFMMKRVQSEMAKKDHPF